MTNSKGSAVIEGNERSQRTLGGLFVVPDSSGEREQALEHASEHTTWGSAAVTLQVELGLERGVDRLDELAQGLEERAGRPSAVALVGRAHQLDTALGEEGLELFGPIALIREDALTRTHQFGLGFEEVPGHVAFVDLGVG